MRERLKMTFGFGGMASLVGSFLAYEFRTRPPTYAEILSIGAGLLLGIPLYLLCRYADGPSLFDGLSKPITIRGDRGGMFWAAALPGMLAAGCTLLFGADIERLLAMIAGTTAAAAMVYIVIAIWVYKLPR